MRARQEALDGAYGYLALAGGIAADRAELLASYAALNGLVIAA